MFNIFETYFIHDLVYSTTKNRLAIVVIRSVTVRLYRLFLRSAKTNDLGRLKNGHIPIRFVLIRSRTNQVCSDVSVPLV